MAAILGAVPRVALLPLPSHIPDVSDLVSPHSFLQNFRPLQSPFRVAARQNWLPVHFSTPVHIGGLRDVAATQRGACEATNQTNKQTKRNNSWQLTSAGDQSQSHNKRKRAQTCKQKSKRAQCLWCIIHHRGKRASWEWRESSKNWKQMFDVSRPEISIIPRCRTPAHAQRRILSGESSAPDIFTSLHPTFDQFQEAEWNQQEQIGFTLYKSVLLSLHWQHLSGELITGSQIRFFFNRKSLNIRQFKK